MLFAKQKRRGCSTYSIGGTGIPCNNKRAHAPGREQIYLSSCCIKITSFPIQDSKQLLLIFIFKKNRKNTPFYMKG